MADIPTDLASSVAQAASRAKQVANVRDAHSTSRAQASQRHVQAIDDAGQKVDTDDADSSVFADAEGGGSQGTPFEDSVDEPAPDENRAEDVTTDDDGNLHLDLEA